jgi:hypothetical protein
MNVFVSNFDALYSEYQQFILGVDTKDLGQLLPLTNLICLKPRGQPFGHSYVPESITLSLPTSRFMLKEARKFQLLLARPEISPFKKAAPLPYGAQFWKFFNRLQQLTLALSQHTKEGTTRRI